jgi:FlaG/FlaF family flagellin (archaellin)
MKVIYLSKITNIRLKHKYKNAKKHIKEYSIIVNMNKPNFLSGSEDSISPVIGFVFLVVITIVLSAVVFTAVTDQGGSINQSQSSEIATSFQQGQNSVKATILKAGEGGELRVNGTEVANFSEGDTGRIFSVENLNEDSTVSVVSNNTNNVQQLYTPASEVGNPANSAKVINRDGQESSKLNLQGPTDVNLSQTVSYEAINNRKSSSIIDYTWKFPGQSVKTNMNPITLTVSNIPGVSNPGSYDINVTAHYSDGKNFSDGLNINVEKKPFGLVSFGEGNQYSNFRTYGSEYEKKVQYRYPKPSPNLKIKWASNVNSVKANLKVYNDSNLVYENSKSGLSNSAIFNSVDLTSIKNTPNKDVQMLVNISDGNSSINKSYDVEVVENPSNSPGSTPNVVSGSFSPNSEVTVKESWASEFADPVKVKFWFSDQDSTSIGTGDSPAYQNSLNKDSVSFKVNVPSDWNSSNEVQNWYVVTGSKGQVMRRCYLGCSGDHW